ncbi:MAG: SapC family protein [Chlorobium sp.]|jgi:hypothetical protein|nr:SapC family protein [Chlorobium sp.]
MEQQNMPLFYQNPVALNKEAHADMTVSPSPEGYRFAASTRAIMIAAVEFFDAGRQFPIIFSASTDGTIFPVALLGLEENENLFVDVEGVWTAPYVPAYIRRYPFITTDGSEGQTTVCFDEAFDGFDLEGGLPLFEDGEPTEKTREIQAFLQDYLLQIQQTKAFGSMLLDAGLLKQIDAQANMADGKSYALNGMLVVDEQKLTQMADVDIVKMFRNGSMALVYAHLLSLRNFTTLINLKAKREG